MDRVVGGSHAARRHDFDLSGPFLNFFPYGDSHVVHAINHPGNAADFLHAGAGVQNIVTSPEIPVTAGLRKTPTSRENPRPGHHIGASGLCQGPIRPTGIAHTGKTAHQDARQDRHGAKGCQSIRHGGVQAKVQLGSHNVSVTVN